jgi:hypothetical protein
MLDVFEVDTSTARRKLATVAAMSVTADTSVNYS